MTIMRETSGKRRSIVKWKPSRKKWVNNVPTTLKNDTITWAFPWIAEDIHERHRFLSKTLIFFLLPLENSDIQQQVPPYFQQLNFTIDTKTVEIINIFQTFNAFHQNRTQATRDINVRYRCVINAENHGWPNQGSGGTISSYIASKTIIKSRQHSDTIVLWWYCD